MSLVICVPVLRSLQTDNGDEAVLNELLVSELTACQEASRFLKQARGTPQAADRTAEFYQAEPARQTTQEGFSS